MLRYTIARSPVRVGMTPVAMLLLSCVLLSGCQSESKEGPTAELVTTEIAFQDITAGSGLDAYQHETGAAGNFWFPESMGPGIGIIDYNADGLQDVLVAGGGTWDGSKSRSVWLFRNEGGLAFTDVTADVGLDTSAVYSMGVVVADYDADGRQDFLLTALDGVRLYRNASGGFDDVTAAAGLAADRGWSTSASFFDAESDGDVDLLIGHYIRWSPDDDLWCSNDGTDKTYCTPAIYEGQPLTYYRNDKGVFTEATEESGLAAGDGKTLGVVAGDMIGDFRPDIYVANDTEPDQLFANQGSGKFEEVGLRSGVAYDERGRSRAGMGVDFGVLDDSGIPSLVVGNFAEEMIGVYQRTGEDVYVDRSAPLRIGLPSLQTLTFGLALIDVNLDGRLDLVAANGHIQPEIGRIRDNVTYAEPAHVFINKGNGSFVDVIGSDDELSRPMVARGMAYADLDLDGDPEILFVENSGGIRLWRNDAVEGGASGMVIGLRTDASRVVLDARVEAFIGGDVQVRSIKSGGSYLSSSEPAAFFATGAGKVDSIRIRWPDGSFETFRDPDASPAHTFSRSR